MKYILAEAAYCGKIPFFVYSGHMMPLCRAGGYIKTTKIKRLPRQGTCSGVILLASILKLLSILR